jgi:hypothetical protein
MAWPEVQPPAYLVPNPTKKPPNTIIDMFLIENIFFQENISLGTIPLKSVNPNAAKSVTVFSEIATK